MARWRFREGIHVAGQVTLPYPLFYIAHFARPDCLPLPGDKNRVIESAQMNRCYQTAHLLFQGAPPLVVAAALPHRPPAQTCTCTLECGYMPTSHTHLGLETTTY